MQRKASNKCERLSTNSCKVEKTPMRQQIDLKFMFCEAIFTFSLSPLLSYSLSFFLSFFFFSLFFHHLTHQLPCYLRQLISFIILLFIFKSKSPYLAFLKCIQYMYIKGKFTGLFSLYCGYDEFFCSFHSIALFIHFQLLEFQLNLDF